MAKKKMTRLCRTDLVKLVANETRLTRKEVQEVLAMTFGLIADTAHDGGTVTIRGFGRFLPRIGGGFMRRGFDVPRRRRIGFVPSLNQRVEVE